MIWSDRKIRANKSIIEPFCDELVQPNSYEVRLADKIIVMRHNSQGVLEDVVVELPYTMRKDEFILGSTIEKVTIPNGVVIQVEGKSTMGRLGVLVHFTAGLCDSGFCGNITLEMMSFVKPVELTAGMCIAQLVFQDADNCDRLYGSCNNHYQNQSGATKAWSDNDV